MDMNVHACPWIRKCMDVHVHARPFLCTCMDGQSRVRTDINDESCPRRALLNTEIVNFIFNTITRVSYFAVSYSLFSSFFYKTAVIKYKYSRAFINLKNRFFNIVSFKCPCISTPVTLWKQNSKVYCGTSLWYY